LVTPTSIYPSFGVETMRGHLGQRWAELVDCVAKLPVTDPYVMALSLTLRRIQKRFNPAEKVSTCREPLCPTCATDIVESFPGSEQELLDLYYRHLDEINVTLKSMLKPHRTQRSTSSAA
jgi:hypothetical protein